MRANEVSRQLPRFICCCGDNKRQLYKTEVLKDGSIKLHEAGFQDTDQFIESFRESTELSTLIARFNAGDVSALSGSVTFFGDQQEMPENLEQAFQIFKTAESAFDYLKPEDKALYGNDFMSWIKDYGSEQFNKTVGLGQDPVQEIKEEAVTE